MHRILAMSLCAGLLAVPALAEAQVRSHTQGFQLSAQLGGASIKAEEGERENGLGIGVGIGYGVSRLVTIALDLDYAGMSAVDGGDDYTLGHGDIGVRLNFGRMHQKLVPYGVAAVGARIAWWEDVLVDGQRYDVEGSGPAFSLGGGTHYYLSPAFALNGGLRVTTGRFDTVKVDGHKVDFREFEFDATSIRLNFGLTWVPSGNRTATLGLAR